MNGTTGRASIQMIQFRFPVILLIAVLTAAGCSSKDLEVGDIQCPDVVTAGTSVTVSIQASGDTGIRYAWSIDPSTAGSFSNPLASVSDLVLTESETDTEATIHAVLSGDKTGPVIRSKDITILGVQNDDSGDDGEPDDEEPEIQIAGLGFDWVEQIGYQFERSGLSVAADSKGNAYVCGVIQLIDYGDLNAFLYKFSPDGSVVWSDIFGESGEQMYARDLVIGPEDELYMCGDFHGDVDFEPGEEITIIENTGIADAFIARYGRGERLDWVINWGKTYATGQCIWLDPEGHLYVTGTYSSWIDFDPGPGKDTAFSLNGYDAYVSKFDIGGQWHWSEYWGGIGEIDWGSYPDCEDSGKVEGLAVCTGIDGKIYVGGGYNHMVDFDPGEPELTYTARSEDMYLTQFTEDGLFSGVYTNGNTAEESVESITSDTDGNIYVAGNFTRRLDFDPCPDIDSHKPVGGRDIFIIKFDPTGQYLWVRTFGSEGNDMCGSITIGPENIIGLCGTFEGTIDFDPGPGESVESGNGRLSGFTLLLDRNGVYLASAAVSGTDRTHFTAIDIDSDFNIYLTGHFYETTDFDPGENEAPLTSGGESDAFLLKLNSQFE